ncbi:MAG: hypothetical protein F2667_11315 [Actinobacteria bacterium]|uniref:Unannotated protein n=1 Tax=freshwater metagenome TaxID=449393 RepID=A0A6J6RLE8_9ZZZZ|nr:hypothetical protein [Actinomycetota bacterium]
MRTLPSVAAALTLGSALALGAAAPASAHGDRDRIRELSQLQQSQTDSLIQSSNVAQIASNPSQVGISGCFLSTAPVFVTSGVDSVRVWDVSDAAHPALTGLLPNVLFENEAMNCGERRTADGVRRFALIGVDLVQASTGDIEHVNVGGGELIVVEVTDPTAPVIVARTPGSTSTHTVACVVATQCKYVYSAGDSDHFSIFDLRDLDHPVEVDSDPATEGVQAFASPTAGHKWNFDAAGIGTHTGYNGASMWSTKNPAKPKLITTTGLAGQGEDPKFEGWNDFILHNSFHPNAKAFRPNAKPSLAHGNILLATEEDYEQTDCAQAGSFQTWWIKRLDGTKDAIVPLDKVELSDLGNFPLPQGAFCSSHWFDYRPGGLVAVGFYGGGTQILDVRKPREIKPYGHALWLASEVWDAMWVPVYDDAGRQTSARTNIVYSIDLIRGLDVYEVDVPDGRRSVPAESIGERASASVVPVGLVAVALAGSLALRRRRRTT